MYGEPTSHSDVPKLTECMVQRKNGEPAFICLWRDSSFEPKMGRYEGALSDVRDDIVVRDTDTLWQARCSVLC